MTRQNSSIPTWMSLEIACTLTTGCSRLRPTEVPHTWNSNYILTFPMEKFKNFRLYAAVQESLRNETRFLILHERPPSSGHFFCFPFYQLPFPSYYVQPGHEKSRCEISLVQ